MRPTIRLTTLPEETHFALLGVLGYCLMRTHFLEPVLKGVRLPLKTVAHSPASKLLDVLVSILARCRAIRHVNTRLRPDLTLAHAWGRERFAEQATLARTLDCFTTEQITTAPRDGAPVSTGKPHPSSSLCGRVALAGY